MTQLAVHDPLQKKGHIPAVKDWLATQAEGTYTVAVVARGCGHSETQVAQALAGMHRANQHAPEPTLVRFPGLTKVKGAHGTYHWDPSADVVDPLRRVFDHARERGLVPLAQVDMAPLTYDPVRHQVNDPEIRELLSAEQPVKTAGGRDPWWVDEDAVYLVPLFGSSAIAKSYGVPNEDVQASFADGSLAHVVGKGGRRKASILDIRAWAKENHYGEEPAPLPEPEPLHQEIIDLGGVEDPEAPDWEPPFAPSQHPYPSDDWRPGEEPDVYPPLAPPPPPEVTVYDPQAALRAAVGTNAADARATTVLEAQTPQLQAPLLAPFTVIHLDPAKLLVVEYPDGTREAWRPL